MDSKSPKKDLLGAAVMSRRVTPKPELKQRITTEVFLNMLSHSGDTGGVANFAESSPGKVPQFREIGIYRGKPAGLGHSFGSFQGKLPGLDSMNMHERFSKLPSQPLSATGNFN